MSYTSKFGIDRVHAINTDNSDDGVAFAVLKITVPTGASAVLQSLSLYVDSGAAGNMRLALYDDTGTSNNPGALKAETASTAAVNGWNTIATTTTPTLAAGNYWIAIQLSSSATTIKFNDAPSGYSVYYVKGYGAFDASFSGSVTGVPRQYLAYATCTTGNQYVGNTGPLGEVETGALGFNIGAKQITTTVAARLRTISINVKTALGNVRVAIYDATGPGGIPGTLIAESASAPATTGWNDFAIASTPTIAAGTYWLAFQASSNTAEFWSARNQVVGDYTFYAFAYGAFPTTYSAAPSTSNLYIDGYAMLDDIPAPPVATGGWRGPGGELPEWWHPEPPKPKKRKKAEPEPPKPKPEPEKPGPQAVSALADVFTKPNPKVEAAPVNDKEIKKQRRNAMAMRVLKALH